MAGFKFRHRTCGAAPTIQEAVFKDTETLTKGDMINLESGKADLGASEDVKFVGVALDTVAGTSNVSKIRYIADADAVYGVVDNNARVKGATLDITGNTGAQGVTASSKKEFVVVADSSATEETLVRFNVGKHLDNTAQ